jgi:hypothetical protein
LGLCNVLLGAQTMVILSGLAMKMLHFMLGEQRSGSDAVVLFDEFHQKVRRLLVESIQTVQEDTDSEHPFKMDCMAPQESFPRLNTIGRIMTGRVLVLTSPRQGLLWWGAVAEGAGLEEDI